LDGRAGRRRGLPVIQRPVGMGAFEFVVLATLRAAQLMRGCQPRVEGAHKATTTAQVEVAEGKVGRLLELIPAVDPLVLDGVAVVA
jgi:hypothetical protein